MKNITFYIPIIFFVLFISCNNKTTNNSHSKSENSSKELNGTITVSGAFALYPMTAKWADEFCKIHPNVRINISAGGAGKGMTDAMSGLVDLGMFSRTISDVEKEKGVWWISVTKDAVLPTINSKSPVINSILQQGITCDEFRKLFISREIKTWGELFENQQQKSIINIYTRSDACGAAQMWGAYLGGNQENLVGIGIYGDPGMAEAVRSDINGIGYNNIIYVYDIKTRIKHPGIEIIPIDFNENGQVDEDERLYNNLDDIMCAIKEERYPSPPARELYFVSKGKPQQNEVIEFLKWILTEGQAFVNDGGYVRLSEEKLNLEFTKL